MTPSEPERERQRAQAPTVRLVRRRSPPEPDVPPDDELEPEPKLVEPEDEIARRAALVTPILTLTLGPTIGWALRWDQDHLASGELVLAPGERPGVRLQAFREWLIELLELTGAVLVAYEQSRERIATTHLEGVLLAQLEGVVDYVAPRPVDVAKHVTGRASATDDDVVEAARARWGKQPASATEARALCVLAWVLDVIGEPR